MKHVITAFAVFFGINTFAATTGVNANQFRCTGENNTDVIFSTTSFIGKPQMSIKFRGADNQAQTSDVQILKTLVGTLATVTDIHLALVDGPTVRFTLLVPQVALDSTSHSEKFSTVAIRTAVANPFFRPAPSARIVENNDVLPVECTAEFVVF